MPVTPKRGGLEIDGLNEAIKALGKLDGDYKREAVQVLREVATDVQHRAQAKIGNAGYRMGRQKGMIGRSATSTGAGIKLRASKYPWAYAAEYGEHVAAVFGRNAPQRIFKRRTAAPFKPPTSGDMSKNLGGYMIQPTIRKRFPHIMKQLDDGLTKLIDRAMRRAGVPK
jgi:hypothetical protein